MRLQDRDLVAEDIGFIADGAGLLARDAGGVLGLLARSVALDCGFLRLSGAFDGGFEFGAEEGGRVRGADAGGERILWKALGPVGVLVRIAAAFSECGQAGPFELLAECAEYGGPLAGGGANIFWRDRQPVLWRSIGVAGDQEPHGAGMGRR